MRKEDRLEKRCALSSGKERCFDFFAFERLKERAIFIKKRKNNVKKKNS